MKSMNLSFQSPNKFIQNRVGFLVKEGGVKGTDHLKVMGKRLVTLDRSLATGAEKLFPATTKGTHD